MEETQTKPPQNQKHKSYLDLVRGLSETKRKMILWVVVIIFGLVLLSFWTKSFQKRLQDFKKEEFKKELNFPELEMPKIEIP